MLALLSLTLVILAISLIAWGGVAEWCFVAGVALMIIFGIVLIVWPIVYINSCFTIADLKSFSQVNRGNHIASIKQIERVVNWQELASNPEGRKQQGKILASWVEAIEELKDKTVDYNKELRRLRDLNEDAWVFNMFKDVPEGLEYIKLKEEK